MLIQEEVKESWATAGGVARSKMLGGVAWPNMPGGVAWSKMPGSRPDIAKVRRQVMYVLAFNC